MGKMTAVYLGLVEGERENAHSRVIASHLVFGKEYDVVGVDEGGDRYVIDEMGERHFGLDKVSGMTGAGSNYYFQIFEDGVLVEDYSE